MGIAGLGVSFAGFAGLIATFAPEEEKSSPVWWWRITAIVRTGLQVTFASFSVIALEAVTGDVELTVRISTLVIVLGSLYETFRHSRSGPAWPDEAQRRTQVAQNLVVSAVMAVNVFVASVGFLLFIMLGLLFAPASVFIRAIADLERIGLRRKT